MSSKYTLPNESDRSFTRLLLVWGLPILGWVALIVGWMLFANASGKSEGEAESKPAEQPAPAQPATPAQPVEKPAPAPAEAPRPEAEKKPSSTVAFPATPYSFTGAVSHIGLKDEASCGTGILVEPATRRVLWAKAPEQAVPIASMTKMMTLLLAEEDIRAGKVKRDTVIPVTVEAYKIGGSQVWLDPKESFPMSELLKAVAIKSANDAAYLVGEYLGGGDIGAFIKRMNQRAKELGMTHSTFYDAHGLGDSAKRNNLASAHDMILLGEQLLTYPEVMRLAATPMDTFRNGKTELKNHNNLVFQRVTGVDGLKTGYTKASGFCVTFSCLRGNRRLLGCVTGFKSAKARDNFCKALLSWGYTK